MKFRYLLIATWLLASCGLDAAETLTVERIQALMAAADEAARHRDSAAIGACLASDFARSVDVSDGEWTVTYNIDRQHYLEMIQQGWQALDDYGYSRADTTIHVAPDGLSAESRSTVTERTRSGDHSNVSRTREYVQYALENGKPVITAVESFELLPDPYGRDASDI